MTSKAAIHVFIGTKAQYIKTVPVLRELDRRGVPYRLIDSGQHGAFSQDLRDELGVREPDYAFGEGRDVSTIPAAVGWALRILYFLISKRRLRDEVFPSGRVCVVHGDTPSTLLAALLARRAGLEVAHLEAGLRSFSYLSPFPEELIRVMVMKMSTILFAPSREAFANLEAMRLKGRIVPVVGNTVIESMVAGELPADDGPPVVTVHRVENLHRPRRLQRLLALVRKIADEQSVLFVVHPPTKEAITKNRLDHLLDHANIGIRALLPHDEFVAHLMRAPFVITDGGSIQEECAVLGVPTLLWRDYTERSDGLGANVVLGHMEDVASEEFLSNPEKYRRDPGDLSIRPSGEIVDHLMDYDDT